MPLYGIVSSDQSDPIYWLRMMLASNRGTLMELGTTPIISSGMIFQLLAGTHLIDVNLDLKADRELYQTAQKLFAIILSFGQACVFVLTGLVSSRLSYIFQRRFHFQRWFQYGPDS
jgi:protein transport protein SEC61 subunit alpha